MLGDGDGRVCGLEVEDNTLVMKDGDTKARGLGNRRVLNVDTVVFCIGDRVDDRFGLPVKWNEFVKNPNPAFPVENLSYEAYDPEAEKPVTGVFVAGWSREASSGLVGVARKDGENGSRAVMQYLQTLPPLENEGEAIQKLKDKLAKTGKPIITLEDLRRLEAVEREQAASLGLEEFKFKADEEMIAAIRDTESASRTRQ
jgi:ferredoxin--NADP+ reductase